MKRYARAHGYGIFTENFTGYVDRDSQVNYTDNAYYLNSPNVMNTSCYSSKKDMCSSLPGNHSCRCGNNEI